MAGSRKNELKALFGGGLSSAQPAAPAPETKSAAEQQSEPAAPPLQPPSPARSASGAVKAMGLTLGSMTKDAEEVRALRQALTEGERVVSVSPDKIDASFVEDRLQLDGRDDEDFTTLVESMLESGQQVPVLLRPHPDRPGHYQTAYGHRRIRAATRLGIEVKAIIRGLSDDELVLAQGKENAERRNLSFIERAVFARNLAAKGFDRKVIGDALSVQKSELSRLMQVVDAVPERFIRLIGAAPKAGRDRWMTLGELLRNADRLLEAESEVESSGFLDAASDQRFLLVFDRLSRKPKAELKPVRELTDASGAVFGRLRKDGRTAKIEFVPGVEADFVEEAAAALMAHYERFKASRKAN